MLWNTSPYVHFIIFHFIFSNVGICFIQTRQKYLTNDEFHIKRIGKQQKILNCEMKHRFPTVAYEHISNCQFHISSSLIMLQYQSFVSVNCIAASQWLSLSYDSRVHFIKINASNQFISDLKYDNNTSGIKKSINSEHVIVASYILKTFFSVLVVALQLRGQLKLLGFHILSAQASIFLHLAPITYWYCHFCFLLLFSPSLTINKYLLKVK